MNLSEIAKTVGISRQRVAMLIRRGNTKEEILSGTYRRKSGRPMSSSRVHQSVVDAMGKLSAFEFAKQLAEEHGLSKWFVYRQFLDGSTLEDATKKRPRCKYIPEGEERTLRKISEDSGIPLTTIYARLRRGMSVDEASKKH